MAKFDSVLFFFVSVLFLSVVFGFAFYWLFMVGFHNVDAGQNFRFLECETGLVISDELVFGGSVSPVESYLLGLRQIFNGVLGLMLSCVVFGVSLMGVLSCYD